MSSVRSTAKCKKIRPTAVKKIPKQTAKTILVPEIPENFVDPALEQLTKRIPQECLAKFTKPDSRKLYVSILLKLIEDALPEGTTILQSLVAERAAFFWTALREIETMRVSGKDYRKKKQRTEEYKFNVSEFNKNMDILRGLSIKNLPLAQVKLLARKTINVIERVVKNDAERDELIREITTEFTIEITPATKKRGEKQRALYDASKE